MAHINDCVPGVRVRVVRSDVARVVGKVGMIVEVSRIKRKPSDPLVDRVIVEIPGHGSVGLNAADVELV